MKGLTHFAAGVAVASCFPAAVQAGVDGNPLYFVLGGACGLLPDTLDFKFGRFFCRHDMEVRPDPSDPDPEMIADALSHAAGRAVVTGKPVMIRLDTIPMGPDLWRQYNVRFDVGAKRVEVTIGPVVSTGGAAVGPADALAGRTGCASVVCPLALDYQAVTTVDIFDGPVFRMTPETGGHVRVEFLPWHREWSHSLSFGLLLGVLAAAVSRSAVAGTVALLACWAHVLVDQLGYMGSALFLPFVRRRVPGLRLVRSREAAPNFLIVWSCCLLVFWNLYRKAGGYLLPITPTQLAVFAGIIPAAALALLERLIRRGQTAEPESGSDGNTEKGT